MATNLHCGTELLEKCHSAPEPAPEVEAAEAINELVALYGEQRVLDAIEGSVIAGRVPGISSRSELHRIAIWILSRIVDAKNPRMAADVMALAVGMRLRQGITITEVAAKYGVSKQAISKMGVEFCEQFNLPPSHVMLPESARDKYRLTNRRREE